MRARISIWILALLVATAALAATAAEIASRGAALEVEYDDLGDDIDACPGGNCSEAQDLIDALDDLDADLSQLDIDYAGCSCPSASLDAMMDGLEADSANLRGIVEEWIT